jgi:hypothetical protein
VSLLLLLNGQSGVSVSDPTFTYDLATAVGQVRFEVGDTNEATALFTDAEIAYQLTLRAEAILVTAADLATSTRQPA